MSVIIFIFILGLLVFVHELGHFAVAKFFKVRVDEFGMGFPPRAVRLFKRGETEYTLNWIPFGGFVKIFGEDALEQGTNDPQYHRSLASKKWWQQILVLIAGVTMNILLAWFLFSASYLIGAPTPASSLENPSLLENPVLTILEVSPQSPAFLAGLQAGDQVVRVQSDQALLTQATREGFISFVQAIPKDSSFNLEIIRGKESQEIILTPVWNSIIPDQQAIGVSLDMVGIYRRPFFKAIGEGFTTTHYMSVETVKAFGKLVSGKTNLSALTGPVGLVGTVGDAQKIGFSYLVILTAIISINLAVINLIPFPALDGGRILFVIIEKIIRRPLPQKAVSWVNGIGFMLLILLMIVVTVKDVVKLF